MTSSEQPPKEYTFSCDCCDNKCKATSYNAIPPDCGCLINSDVGAIWKLRPHPAPATGQQEIPLLSNEEIEGLQQSLEWYKKRANMLQCWQSSMRDPERKIVCDILANGFTLTTKEEVDNAEAAIARKAREDVLNKLTVAVADMGFPMIDKTNEFDDGRACAYGYFMREISKLRGGGCTSCHCLVSDEDVKMEEELRDFPNEGDGY
jgi:hypothetical protein